MDAEALFRWLKHQLQARFSEGEAKSLALRLMEDGLGLGNKAVLLRQAVAEGVAEQLQGPLDRLLAGEPLQYILGTAEFAGLRLQVGAGVLIPRPETEELLQRVVDQLAAGPLPHQLLDLGTGSGCLALGLKQHFPAAEVWALEYSPQALEQARANAARNGLRVRWQAGDMREAADWPSGPFDAIVSNPPYVREREKAQMAAHVLNHEPGEALFVPDADPLLFYRPLLRQGLKRLRPGGLLAAEINEAMGPQVAALARELGFRQAEILQDFWGKERFFWGWSSY